MRDLYAGAALNAFSWLENNRRMCSIHLILRSLIRVTPTRSVVFVTRLACAGGVGTFAQATVIHLSTIAVQTTQGFRDGFVPVEAGREALGGCCPI